MCAEILARFHDALVQDWAASGKHLLLVVSLASQLPWIVLPVTKVKSGVLELNVRICKDKNLPSCDVCLPRGLVIGRMDVDGRLNPFAQP